MFKPVAKSRSLDWTKILDIPRAVGNLEREASGDWHRDPWGWPENRYLLKKPELMVDRLNEDGVGAVAIVDVPKENFAARPAVVLDPLDRLSYMALVDHFSKALIGDMATHAYGWRLSVEDPASGQYARNGDEWERFRRHLANAADEYEGLLLSDIVSCFASIPVHHMNDMLEQTLPQGRPLDRLLNLLDGWDKTPGRRGLPQRSSASAVLANAYMRDLDLVLQANSKAFSKSSRSGGRPRSWARWMDDMWLFGDDVAKLRHAQVELQNEAASLGLNLNSSKTELLEGEDVLERALEIEHSAIDQELDIEMLIGQLKAPRKKRTLEMHGLSDLISRIIHDRESASRTNVRFATTRMRTYKKFERASELLDVANRMPHCADHLARLFRVSVGVSDYQDWFLHYTKSPWASYEWAIANFGTALASSRRPRKATREYFAEVLADGRRSLPLFALAAQRLSGWDSDECRLALREAVKSATTPHHLRIAAFAGLASGERRSTVRGWLAGPENRLTTELLESLSFRAPRTSHDFAGDE
ncbi:RNA-directed DNA polymerase [Terrabacter aerolatus]|nr:RNA-directed DNA polymerase [Terrabacter aerolatus]